MSHFLHLFFAFLLFAGVFADVFFLRHPRSEAIEPRELILSWRKKIAIYEMVVFVGALALGLAKWLPLIKAYPPEIFHTKLLLALVFVILAKVRMLKERRGDVQVRLTRLMAGLLLVILCLGIAGGLR